METPLKSGDSVPYPLITCAPIGAFSITPTYIARIWGTTKERGYHVEHMFAIA